MNEKKIIEKCDGFKEIYGPWFYCPNCNKSTLLPKYEFCSSCGQAVKWPDNYKDYFRKY